MLDVEEVRESAAALRRVVAAVDGGDLDASGEQRAFLAGAVVALEGLSQD